MQTEILLNGITANELKTDILNGIDKLIKDNLNSKSDKTTYLTRKETADLLKVDISTLHNWNKKGILKPKEIGRRVYYVMADIKNAML